MFAGPGVAGAIRNQFNLVGNTLNSGTGGNSFMSAEEKAHQEAIKNIASKDAKDWTLDEQKAAADDIAKNGTSSIAYAKAEAAMKAETEWSVKLTNGKMLEYRIIGINHDDLADGTGKAGLTFMTNTTQFGHTPPALRNSIDDWEKSELRQRMNSGDLWNLLPSDLRGSIKAVVKDTGKGDAHTSTADKLFLISTTEIYGTGESGGYQYEYYAPHKNFATGFAYISPLFCF